MKAGNIVRIMLRLPHFTLFLCLPVFAADQVVLNNGDILNGSIVRKDGTRLVLKSELFGELTMPWTAVKSVHGDTADFVHLFASDSPKTKVSTSGDEVLVVTTGGTKT